MENNAETEALGHLELEEADGDGDMEAEAFDHQELEVVDDVEAQAFGRLDELLADVDRVDALLGATFAGLNANAAQLRAARAEIEDAAGHAAVVDAAFVLPEAVEDLVEERRRLVRVAVWLVLVRAVAVADGRVHLVPGVGLAIVAAQAIVRAASRGAVVVGGMSYVRITILITTGLSSFAECRWHSAKHEKHSAKTVFAECFFCRVYFIWHSAKTIFAECPIKYTR